MTKPKKLIAVIAPWEIAGKYVKEAAIKAAEMLGIDYEEREEDWDFLVEHGEKDEYGGVEIPQLFVEYEDGKIKHIFNHVPLNDKGKPDIRRAIEMIRKKVMEDG